MAVVYVSNLVLYTDTDFEQTFILEDAISNSVMNLSDYAGSAQFRRYRSSSVSGTFNVYVSNALLGKIRLQLSADQTKNIKPGKYFYDLNITSPSGNKTRVVEGTLIVKKSITR